MPESNCAASSLAAWTAILSAPIAFAALYLYCAPLGFDLSVMLRPQEVLTLGAADLRWMRLGLLGDALGYYLLYIPIIAFLRASLRVRDQVLVDSASCCGLLYVAFGFAGVTFQAAVLPVLADAHRTASTEVQASLEAAWLTVAAATMNGLWFFECSMAAVWYLVVGFLGAGQSSPWLGALATIVGMGYGASFIMGLDHIGEASRMAQMTALALAPAWALLVGVGWLRRGASQLDHDTLRARS